MKKNKLVIVWEDEHLVVVDKPAGLLAIPGRFDSEESNLKALLKKKYNDIWVVHRIDKDTSGLLCFAKNKEAHSFLSQEFANHQPEKKYLAVTSGNYMKSSGDIEFNLIENPQKRGRMMTAKKGKSAFTSYVVQELFRSFALVEVTIKTGRTHQIRVHLQAIGHPILADSFYSAGSTFLLSTIKGKKFRKAIDAIERPLLSRTALHAFQLSFKHPKSGELLHFEAPLPKDMNAVLKQLRKWDK